MAKLMLDSSNAMTVNLQQLQATVAQIQATVAQMHEKVDSISTELSKLTSSSIELKARFMLLSLLVGVLFVKESTIFFSAVGKFLPDV